MTIEFAVELVDARLLQTARLLEWMLKNVVVDEAEAVSVALGAVMDARNAMKTPRTALP